MELGISWVPGFFFLNTDVSAVELNCLPWWRSFWWKENLKGSRIKISINYLSSWIWSWFDECNAEAFTEIKKGLFHKGLGQVRELSGKVTALCFLPVKGDLPGPFVRCCETSLVTKLVHQGEWRESLKRCSAKGGKESQNLALPYRKCWNEQMRAQIYVPQS